MTAVLGWDVGGVNTKVARVVRGTVAAARAQPYEIQRDPTALGSLLARLAAEQRVAGAAHAVTMTAELSQFFRTKREGVRFVLDAVTAAFPEADVRVYTADGRFLSVAAARIEPLAVAAAGCALAGDVSLWLGSLAPEDYTVPTPDGRPATREFAGERLARVICADRELLDEAAIDAIARSLADAQVGRVSAAIERVARRHPRVACAVVTGLGDFIAAAAARRAGLRVTHLAERLGPAARHAPAAAVALLLDAELAPHAVHP